MRSFLLLLLMLGGVSTGLAQRPKIESTSPAFWAVNVDAAAQKELSITFDQPMRYKFSSWLGASSVFPESKFDAHTAPDGLTFTLSVSLRAGKVYVFALNEKSISGVGFQTKRGVALTPHFLVFQTAGKPTPEDAPPTMVKSVPRNADQQVDPVKTAGITLTFDKPMRMDKHGLHLFENNTPVDLSKTPSTYSVDGLTFTLNHQFKPEQEYRVELNSVNDIGFASKDKLPLWPVRITFKTIQPQ